LDRSKMSLGNKPCEDGLLPLLAPLVHHAKKTWRGEDQ